MTAADEPGEVPALRSMALDVWALHLLRCPTCTNTDELCRVAVLFVASFGEHLNR